MKATLKSLTAIIGITCLAFSPVKMDDLVYDVATGRTYDIPGEDNILWICNDAQCTASRIER